jgi:hypothetical protein
LEDQHPVSMKVNTGTPANQVHGHGSPRLYEVHSNFEVGEAKHIFAYPFGGGFELGSQECTRNELALVGH